jgi:hypothetical protein
VKDEAQIIADFIEWANAAPRHLTLCQPTESTVTPWRPAATPRDRLVAEFLGIDLDRLESEKRAMLAMLRPCE